MENNLIIIGTDLDKRNFEKKYNNIKNKLQREELNLKIKTDDYETTKHELEQIQQDLEAIEQAREKINKQVADYKELEDAFKNLKPGQAVELSQEDAEYFKYLSNNIDKLRQQQVEYNSLHENLVEDLEKANLKYEKASVLLNQQKEKTVEIRQQYEGFNDAVKQHNLEYAQSQLNGINKSLTGIIKKVGRWALAIFGVRSAYMYVRSAINVISQEDEQLKNDIQTVKIALAYTIEPLVRKIVDLARTLVGYIAYIIYAWSGGKRDIFARAKDNLASASKSAKELKKTSASFDKFNKLGSDSSAGGGSGISPMSIPDNVPKWVEWIAQNKQTILDLGKVLLVAFGASAIAKVLANIATLFGVSGGMGLIGLYELLLLIAAPILITIAVKKVGETIKQIKEINEQLDGTTKQMKKTKEKAKELNNQFWELYEQGKLNDQQIQSHIEFTRSEIELDATLTDTLEDQKSVLGELFGFNKRYTEQQNVANASIRTAVEEYRKMYEQGLLNKQQQDDYRLALEKAMEAFNKQGISIRELQKEYRNLTATSYKLNVVAEFETAKAEGNLRRVRDLLKQIVDYHSYIGGGTYSFGWGGNGGARAKGGIYYPKMPKLASGGIINMPGRGVAYHGATIAERGAEAVVPLTDTQQMELLGATIGKHVKFDANITLELEGRILAKVLQEIQNNNNFIRNGG